MTKEQLFSKWTINPDFKYDLNAVIATEIAKAQEANPQPEELKGNCTTFDGSRLVDQEYKPTEQPTKPFDRDRFEAMFRAVVESGANTDIDYSIKVAENALKQLDAYYAEKGGNNG